MKLFLLHIEEFDGSDHHLLIAARSMNQEKAEKYALKYIFKTGGFNYGQGDIEVTFKDISEVDGYADKLGSNNYIVKVSKKGFLHEWFNLKRG